MNLQTQTQATAAPTGGPASYVPTPADLDEMHLARTVHDLLDLAPDLPLETKLSLLDYVAGVLGGNGQAAPEPRHTA